MPQAGTKKIILEGRDTFVPADEAELAEIIALGLAATEDMEAAKKRLEDAKARFLGIAELRRQGRSSITIAGLHGGKAQAKWASEKKLDQERLKLLKAVMPNDLFRELFEEETVFRFTKDASKLLKAAHSPALAPHVKAVLGAIDVKPKNPSVKFLGNEDSEIEGDDE